MLLKTFSFGTQIRTFTNSNDFLQKKLIPVHSGVIPVHSGVIPVHSGPFRCHSGPFRSIPVSFRFIPVHSGVIPVHSGPFWSIPLSFRFIPVHSGPFHLIPVHSAPFRCLVTPASKTFQESQFWFFNNIMFFLSASGCQWSWQNYGGKPHTSSKFKFWTADHSNNHKGNLIVFKCQ